MANLRSLLKLAAWACLVACSKNSGVDGIDAGPAAPTSTLTPMPWTVTATTQLDCPKPVHPDYCEGECRGFAVRQASHHATRIVAPNRWATGTCGAYGVFAEDDAAFGDAGIVEWYDDGGTLVAAEDHRADAGCNQFGAIPSCVPSLAWTAAKKPHVRLTEVTAIGLPENFVRRMVRQQVGRASICYDKRSAKSSALAGKLVVGFDIDRAGLPTHAARAPGSDLADEAVANCMIAAVTQATFVETDADAGKISATVTIEVSP